MSDIAVSDSNMFGGGAAVCGGGTRYGGGVGLQPGLGPGHDSMSCKKNTIEGEPGGHVNVATHSNPVVPGKNKNKGWDDFFT